MRRRWALLIQILIVGYSSLGRVFAYIGLFPINLFIGEMTLGWFAITRQDAVSFFFVGAKRNRAVELLRYSILIFVGYGVVSILLGHFNQQPISVAAQNFAFNYYVTYLIVGTWVALKNPPFMHQLALGLAWFHGVYGTLWVIILNRIDWFIPGTMNVQIFGQPSAAAVSILMLLSYERRFERVVIPCLLNLFVMMGVQVRAEWVGFMLGFVVWSTLSKKLSHFVSFVLVAVVLISLGLFFNVRLPGTAGRGGEVSVQGVVGRFLAPFDPDLASKYVEGASGLGGTAKWREDWWHNIWQSVNKTDERTFLLGHGYGYPIAGLTQNVQEDVRSPHCVFYFALCYGGWCGVTAFGFLQLSIGYGLYRGYKLTGQAFGFSYWVTYLSMSFLGNSLETPFGAIPFYLICGIGLRPMFEDKITRARTKFLEQLEQRGLLQKALAAEPSLAG